MQTVLHRVENVPNTLLFECPGCGECHQVPVKPGDGVRWEWNGSLDKPTFSPSLLVRGGPLQDEHGLAIPGARSRCCHSFVRDGQIQFLNDCTHKLAGQTVDLPAW